MELFVEGDIVVIPFPFSDLSREKKRPALVLKKLAGKDLLFCQITKNSYRKSEEVPIKKSDFLEGKLKFDSNVRVSKLFTGNISLVKYKAGKIKKEKLEEIKDKLVEIIRED